MNEKTDRQNIWENFLEFIRSWSSTASEKAGEFTRTAATKAEEWSKVGRLKVDIYQLQREQSRMFADLGRIAFDILEGKEKSVLGAHEGAADLHRRVSAINAEISRKEKEIEEAAKAEEMARKKGATPKAKPTGGTETKTTTEKKQAAPKPAAPKPAAEKPAEKASTGATKRASTAGAKKTTGGAKKKTSTAPSKAAPKKQSGTKTTKSS